MVDQFLAGVGFYLFALTPQMAPGCKCLTRTSLFSYDPISLIICLLPDYLAFFLKKF